MEPFIVRSGRWLTKRRGMILTPLFAVAFLAARNGASLWAEMGQDLLGLLCLGGGTWLRMTAASYHEEDNSTHPITAGPYAWVRHPLYLSNFLLGLGIVLVAGWPPMMAVYAAVFLPLHFVIARSEEAHLIALYGREYEDYRRAVPAILPWRPLQGARYGVSSSFKLKEGKEWLKVAGYLAGMGAILLFKQWRGQIPLEGLTHLSLPACLLAGGAVALAVALQQRLHQKWLRAFLKVLAAACALVLALQVPGVWGAPAMAHRLF